MTTPVNPNACLATAMQDAAQAAADRGVVYLLHFDRPYRHAAHYTGWTSHPLDRLDEHETGRGARLLAGITRAQMRPAGWATAIPVTAFTKAELGYLEVALEGPLGPGGIAHRRVYYPVAVTDPHGRLPRDLLIGAACHPPTTGPVPGVD